MAREVSLFFFFFFGEAKCPRVVAVERQSVRTLKTLEFSMSRSRGVKGVLEDIIRVVRWFFGQQLIKISKAIWQTLRKFILLGLCITTMEYSLYDLKLQQWAFYAVYDFLEKF